MCLKLKRPFSLCLLNTRVYLDTCILLTNLYLSTWTPVLSILQFKSSDDIFLLETTKYEIEKVGFTQFRILKNITLIGKPRFGNDLAKMSNLLCFCCYTSVLLMSDVSTIGKSNFMYVVRCNAVVRMYLLLPSHALSIKCCISLVATTELQLSNHKMDLEGR